MSNSYFSFKRFTVHQDRCAMKVGTDGTLLGAWANGGLRILDVGTGTGLIALMMAQRFPLSSVEAIDIDADACAQAVDNVLDSPFSSQIKVTNISFQDFVSQIGGARYDTIVCNPPFFENSLSSPDAKRDIARHASALSFADLLAGVRSVIAPVGIFSVVLPVECYESFDAEARLVGFRCSRRTVMRTVPRKLPRRLLLEYMLEFKGECLIEEHSVLDLDGANSDWYKSLTADFYLQL